MGRPETLLARSTLVFLLLLLGAAAGRANPGVSRQESLDEWRALTSPAAAPPKVFVKGDHVRMFFTGATGQVAFSASWSRLRVPTGHYRVSSALLRWDQKLTQQPDHPRGWREATVIAGAEWRQLATNLLSELAPPQPGHGAYYQAFLSDRLVYRDAHGTPRFALLSEQPPDIVIDHRFSLTESLEVLAWLIEAHLNRTHPSDSLLLIMAPDAKRFTQPLLLDRRQPRCVFLAPAVLYDTTERGITLSGTAQGLIALLPESHGLALLKNPFSSAVRLADPGLQAVAHFVRFPWPKPGAGAPLLTRTNGMDLPAWEAWLDRYTGTRRQSGSLSLLLDGDKFFPRLRQAFDEATNHIRLELYIFDKDDVGVGIADQLKQRSQHIEVKALLDRLGCLGAGAAPPATPMPEDFVPPSSITSYLREGSRVHVRSFLNPWLSADHSKIILVDGTQAWLGGMNFGREYRYEWHDLMVELNGPVVASLESQFRRHWAHAGLLGDLAYLGAVLSEPKIPASAPAPVGSRWIDVRLLPSSTAWKPFAAAVLGAIQRANSYIYIENPYLFDKRVILALARARNRGVDVRVVQPCVNDFKAGGRSNLVVANYLLAHGVHVYFYPGMTHVKALQVDGWSCLGSGNLNNLSLRLNHEENVATSDPAFAARLKRDLFESDFARCYELTEPLSVDWVDFLSDLVLEGF